MEDNSAPPIVKRTALVPQEVRFIKALAGNEKAIRDRALRKLRKWFVCRCRGKVFTEENFQRVWCGLFYCMWMSDKPLVQEELAENISKLIHCFNIHKDSARLFMKTFFEVMRLEWPGIDQHRLDKFCMLIRRFVRQSLVFCQEKNWNGDAVRTVAAIFQDGALTDESPRGYTIHFIDIFLEELSKVGKGNLNSETVLIFLDPILKLTAITNDTRLHAAIESFFNHLIRQTDIGMIHEEKFKAWKLMKMPCENPEELVAIADVHQEVKEEMKEEANEKANEEVKKKLMEVEEEANAEASGKANEESNGKANEEANGKANEEANGKANEEANEEANGKANEEANEEANGKANEEANEEASGKANEETSEKANEEANEETSEKANGKANEEANEETSEKANEETNEKANEETNEKANEKASEEANEKASEEANEKANEKASEEANEKANEEGEVKEGAEVQQKIQKEANNGEEVERKQEQEPVLDPRAGRVDALLPQIPTNIDAMLNLIQKYMNDESTTKRGKHQLKRLRNKFLILKSGKMPESIKLPKILLDLKKKRRHTSRCAKDLMEYTRNLFQEVNLELESIENDSDEEPVEVENASAGNDNSQAEGPSAPVAENVEMNPSTSNENADKNVKKSMKDIKEIKEKKVTKEKKLVKVPKRTQPADFFIVENVAENQPLISTTSYKRKFLSSWKVDDVDNDELNIARPKMIRIDNRSRASPQGNEQRLAAEQPNPSTVNVPRRVKLTAAFWEKAKEKACRKKKTFLPNPMFARQVKRSKRISFALDRNEAQENDEYLNEVRNSPNIPFDGARKPVQSALKSGSAPSPINPFYKFKKPQ